MILMSCLCVSKICHVSLISLYRLDTSPTYELNVPISGISVDMCDNSIKYCISDPYKRKEILNL
jgi:hypothetical protein